jgi:hypothetical protein
MSRLRAFALVIGLGILLAACNADCVACKDVERVGVVVVNLCVSEVPDPVQGEKICAEPASVTYTFVPAAP